MSLCYRYASCCYRCRRRYRFLLLPLRCAAAAGCPAAPSGVPKGAEVTPPPKGLGDASPPAIHAYAHEHAILERQHLSMHRIPQNHLNTLSYLLHHMPVLLNASHASKTRAAHTHRTARRRPLVPSCRPSPSTPPAPPAATWPGRWRRRRPPRAPPRAPGWTTPTAARGSACCLGPRPGGAGGGRPQRGPTGRPRPSAARGTPLERGSPAGQGRVSRFTFQPTGQTGLESWWWEGARAQCTQAAELQVGSPSCV